jgi:ubiquinone/menaquinone biosynthesis C-methylase UbiE
LSAKERVLTQTAVQAYYDRFGQKQDSQGFYENAALDDLTAHTDFQNIQNVFEFGCGTGKLAVRLLENHLSSSAKYLGFDISPVMIGLAKQRLAAYGARAQVALSDGAIRFPCSDHSIDCIVSTYVLDLLSESDIQRCFSESRRVLVPDGKLCLASLTSGVSLLSRIVSSLWKSVFRLKPSIVGGCRPIRLDSFTDSQEWQVIHKRVVTPFGVPSEVLILVSRSKPNK